MDTQQRRQSGRTRKIRRQSAHIDRLAERLAAAEHAAWLEAQAACFACDRFRSNVEARLILLAAGAPERFCGERRLAQMALEEAARADVVYAVLSFAPLGARLALLTGGRPREDVLQQTFVRGGVFDPRGHFLETPR